ncbi:site-specific integrase [Nitrosospira sp. Nsp13]|uniref:site-specific integrase n=1 Tax=Nitrosospira sp. Nsp13 TaxID=1855332 RepID=UPI00088A22DE|nr:site-specific integrase [Nitrosospira sp. Nsp13]SCY38198.1 Site-specific recombinase XerD [Nitrosospira sp. Nsp13]
MAAIQKRIGRDGDVSYRVQIRLKGHRPETASFQRLTDAKEWAAKTETAIRAGRHFGQSKRRTFNDLADEYQVHAKNIKCLDHWRKVFGNDLLDKITPSRINKERDRLLSETTTRFVTAATGDPKLDAKRKRSLRTGSTVNRYLAALSSCLSYGVKTEWIERNPCERVTKPKEGEGRVRFLTDEERPRLLAACRPHPDLYLAVVLALTTGARQAELMTLRWHQIDFKRQVITLDKTKNGDKRALALVGEAFALLQERGKLRNLKDDRIFPPTKYAKKAQYLDLRAQWEAVLKVADLKDFHWHDLRHTAASYLAMSGVSLVEIAKVLGHRTMQMVARYSHLSDGHIVATGEKLATRLGVGK